jgi:ABC-type lipoprotein export system ATPase subunit
LTVLENVILPRKIHGSIEGSEKEAKALLKIVGLESQLDKFANKVSGGQAQRVAITRALINKPAIVLADEPTGSLDSISAETTVQLLKSLNRKLNQTFIIITHERPQFGEVDKVVTIKDGRILEGEELEASLT